jgi:hypothetical protein
MIEMRWLEPEGMCYPLILQYRDVRESPYGDLVTAWIDVPVVKQPAITLSLNDRISLGHHGIST